MCAHMLKAFIVGDSVQSVSNKSDWKERARARKIEREGDSEDGAWRKVMSQRQFAKMDCKSVGNKVRCFSCCQLQVPAKVCFLWMLRLSQRILMSEEQS